MTRDKHIPAGPTPVLTIQMKCRACGASLTPPLRLLNPVPPRVVRAGEQLLDRGEAAFTHALGTRGDAVGRYRLDHGVVVNTQDTPETTCYQSTFGCCGHDPHEGPNLLCANGHLVGSFADECYGPHFAHLSLEHCEFFPLSPGPENQGQQSR